jgi:hypothetical protein
MVKKNITMSVDDKLLEQVEDAKAEAKGNRAYFPTHGTLWEDGARSHLNLKAQVVEEEAQEAEIMNDLKADFIERAKEAFQTMDSNDFILKKAKWVLNARQELKMSRTEASLFIHQIRDGII